MEPVSVSGVGDFYSSAQIGSVDWFELARMNFRNNFARYGKGNLADDDRLVNAYIFSTDPTKSAADKAYAQNVLLQALDGGPSSGSGASGPSKAQQAAGVEAQLRDLAAQFGVSEQDWAAISWEAVNNGWNAAMLQNAVADHVTMESIKREGKLKDSVTKARDTAAQYFVTVNDNEALDWAKRIARDELPEESMVSSIRDRAKAQYYWLANVIDQGTTLKEYFKPHTQTIAQLLETSPDAINLMGDEKWAKVIRRTPDSIDGTERAMNLFETANYVRSLDEWKNTGNAKATSATAVNSIGKLMGAI